MRATERHIAFAHTSPSSAEGVRSRRRGRSILVAALLCLILPLSHSHLATAAPKYAVAIPSATVRSVISIGNHDRPLMELSTVSNDSKLQEQLRKLIDAMNRRDLEAIRSQISPSRIYVEIVDRTGAYLSSSQTMVVMESFFRSRSSVTSTFDFVSDDGQSGSASGTLTARKDGRTVSYKLNFGFTKNEKGVWLLSRISMR